MKIVSPGAGFGETFDFAGASGNGIRIGKGQNCEIRLDSRNFAEKQCVIHRNDDGFVLVVLAKQPSVRINGTVVETSSSIRSGDTIHVGLIALLFTCETIPDPTGNPRDLQEEQGLALLYEAFKHLAKRLRIGKQGRKGLD